MSTGRGQSALRGGAGVVLHDAFFLALPVFFACRIALVEQLLAAAQREVQLDAAVLVVQVQRHQGVAALFDLADQLADFLGLEQQLARAHGIGMDVGGRRGQGADVHAQQVQFAIAHDDVAFLELHAAIADRLDFPALQDQAGLVAVFDEIVVRGLAVIDNAHLVLPIFLGPSCWGGRRVGRIFVDWKIDADVGFAADSAIVCLPPFWPGGRGAGKILSF